MAMVSSESYCDHASLWLTTTPETPEKYEIVVVSVAIVISFMNWYKVVSPFTRNRDNCKKTCFAL